jgi:porphobilinogen synthase
MNYPDYRPRRMRRTENFRRMIRETRLSPSDFIYPLFVVPGSGVAKPIASMPGQFNYSIDKAVDAAAAAADLGIPAVILFGVPEKKDAVGSEAWKDNGIIQKAIRAVKKARPELVVMADACFCEYTDHGHCGILHDGELDNDASLENLARTVVSYAKAGVDVVAPSGMLDGFVMACRESLDEDGFDQVAIMAYSAKSATPSTRRRRKATAAAIRWIRATSPRRCARSRSTSPRAPTSSWSSRRSPTSTSSAR